MPTNRHFREKQIGQKTGPGKNESWTHSLGKKFDEKVGAVVVKWEGGANRIEKAERNNTFGCGDNRTKTVGRKQSHHKKRGELIKRNLLEGGTKSVTIGVTRSLGVGMEEETHRTRRFWGKTFSDSAWWGGGAKQRPWRDRRNKPTNKKMTQKKNAEPRRRKSLVSSRIRRRKKSTRGVEEVKNGKH